MSQTPRWDPGRVTLHRLNRVEYNNTVRDLLGTALRPADAFPPDDRGSGFDNLADLLSLSPVHLSLYVAAAEQLVSESLSRQAQRLRVVGCDLNGADARGCVQTSLRAFARRAWRRPVADAEVERLMVTAATAPAHAQGWEEGLALALQAVLVSPHFIFRVEVDDDPTSTSPRRLNDHELATRLSYLLWSSMPDDELAQQADAGALNRGDELSRQVRRMLASPKADALVDNFGGQWLHVRKLDESQPDPGVFPGFDAALRSAMREETRLLFADVVSGREPVSRILDADFTYVNDRLARHYGLGAVGSDTHRRVALPENTRRGGFLGHGSFLTVTSHPTRTSPVLRGKWVTSELLCQDVPPPPPDLEVDLEQGPDDKPQSLRERLAAHAKSACAGCHDLMDSIGFGLENFDAVGAFRTKDGDFAVDAAGSLPGGQAFSGARELGRLVARQDSFADCLANRVYTYALARQPSQAPEHLDGIILAELATKLRGGGQTFGELLTSIVTSRTFLERRGEPAQPGVEQ